MVKQITEEYKKKKSELRKYIHEFMKSHNIGVGNSEFAKMLGEIAAEVDD